MRTEEWQCVSCRGRQIYLHAVSYNLQQTRNSVCSLLNHMWSSLKSTESVGKWYSILCWYFPWCVESGDFPSFWPKGGRIALHFLKSLLYCGSNKTPLSGSRHANIRFGKVWLLYTVSVCSRRGQHLKRGRICILLYNKHSIVNWYMKYLVIAI